MPNEYLAVAAAGFLLGGVLFSYHLPMLLKGVDIVEASEDHNPGTANAVRYAGVWVGMLCLAADVLKGFLPVYIGMRFLDVDSVWFSLAAAAPVVGHALAPFYRFPGGKAIAVSFGVMAALASVSDGLWILAGTYIFFSIIVPIRPDERRTVTTFAVFMLWALLAEGKRRLSLMAGYGMISLIVMWKNRKFREKTGNNRPHMRITG